MSQQLVLLYWLWQVTWYMYMYTYIALTLLMCYNVFLQALDGKVERDENGKEIRYPVLLTAQEKLIARKVCLAFNVHTHVLHVIRYGIHIINISPPPLHTHTHTHTHTTANCVWFWPSASQWKELRLWRQRLQFCQKLTKVLQWLCADPSRDHHWPHCSTLLSPHAPLSWVPRWRGARSPRSHSCHQQYVRYYTTYIVRVHLQCTG